MSEQRVDQEPQAQTGHWTPLPAGYSIRCPACGQTLDARQEHCPWDGTSLAGGVPVVPATDEDGTVREVSEGLPVLFGQELVSLDDLEGSGLAVHNADYAAVGGGIGSFIWADVLRVCGVKSGQISVLGPYAKPYGHYGTLAHNSQMPEGERIRSNSESTPDNLWGWPGYAAREAARDCVQGRPGQALGALWKTFGEPTLAETYTPKLGAVLRSVDREAARIGWDAMLRPARVRAVRKTDDGRYAILYYPVPFSGVPSPAVRLVRHVHLAVGYPGLKVLEDVRRYREATGDLASVVSAYEEHDHVYERLRERGGLVLLRGRGVVASRVLQRIDEERRRNPDVGVLHLMQAPVPEGRRSGRSSRAAGNHFEYQPFNWPRGAWGGEQRRKLEQATPEERGRMLAEWGGTTTARRREWVEIIERGLREGWYQSVFGRVERFGRRQGQLVADIELTGSVRSRLHCPADFVIDATGLQTEPGANPLLDDAIETYGLELNPLGRLPVKNDFEVLGLQNGTGRVYAAGAMTLGGPYAGVDTFLGLQYAALHSADALARAGAPGLRRLGGLRSAAGWTKWALGVAP